MDLPSHPEADDPATSPRRAPEVGWPGKLVIGVIVAVVVAMVLLHLTGVVGPAR